MRATDGPSLPTRSPWAWVLAVAAVCSALGFAASMIGMATDLDGPGRCLSPAGPDSWISDAGIWMFLVATPVLALMVVVVRHRRWLLLWLGAGLALQVALLLSGVLPRLSESHCASVCESGDALACAFWGNRSSANRSALSHGCESGALAKCEGAIVAGGEVDVDPICERIRALSGTIDIPATILERACPDLPCDRFRRPPPRCREGR